MVHGSLRDVRQHYYCGYLLNCDFLLLKRKKESTLDTVMVLLKIDSGVSVLIEVSLFFISFVFSFGLTGSIFFLK